MSSRDPRSETEPDDGPGPRGLWGVMGRERSEEEPAGEGGPAEANTDHGSDAEAEADDTAGERQRIEPPTAVDDESVESTPGDADPIPGKGEPAVGGKGLWAVMSGAGTTAVDDDSADQSDEFGDDADAEDVAAAGEEAAADEELASEADPAMAIASAPAALPRGVAPVRRTAEAKRRGMLGALLGVCSMPLAALAMLPQVVWKLPGPACGFLAMVLSLMVVSRRRRSGERAAGRVPAVLGLVAGTAGMFLGPLLFSGWGESLRYTTDRGRTAGNLEAIGGALGEYHEAHAHFPSGGSYEVDAAGNEVPMHGWMTSLLPYLGEVELYEAIDLEQPFDAEKNFAVTRREVEAFLAAGAERSKVGRGFGAAHFAGLGGELDVEGVGLANVGIFDRDSRVAREEITDGLSQTLIVGEIAHEYPPWAAPGNWRMIGRGLNADLSGFGNARGTGALFLRADGSVRFFANATSPEILRKLSTRNGQEFVPPTFD